MKIRINDLARELEVKSKQILDVLIKVGVTEKKTHSSSVEPEEAEKVRNYFREISGSPARYRSGSEEFRPRIDLSKISKPGDAMKAILARKESSAETAKTARPNVTLPPTQPKVIVNKPADPRPAPPVVPERVPRLVTPESVAQRSQVARVEPPKPPMATAPIVKAEQPTGPATSAQSAEPPVAAAPANVTPSAPPTEAPVGPTPATEAPTPVATPETAPVETASTPAAPVVPAAQGESAPGSAVTPHSPAAQGKQAARKQPQTGSARPPLPGQPPAPARRMIVPQTGPRPVYTAPPPPPPRPTPPPSALGNRTGLPVRGQPIFQRPRPGQSFSGPSGAPGSRPPFTGERRPMHPTRSTPTPGGRPPMGGRPGMGPRPGGPPRPGGLLGAAAGAPPPGAAPRPGARTGAPARRPGQRYQGPRGKQEGPMKGFTPPPRLSLSNEPMPITRTITISEGVSVKDLAEKLEIRAKDLIARLLARGVFATINQTLSEDLARDMARHFGAESSVISFEDQIQQDYDAQAIEQDNEAVFNTVTRPPVVTIMGHVDHGKTSLLDAIRSTSVAEGEAGGITQHIGAYKVKITDSNSPAFGREIVFLDTPGHEAFTRMRARGAKVTDIVILVVAADDGVMPQTLEAIDHAKAAKVPLIVAVNKIDKPDAMPDRVKKQLADRGLLPEDWGGDTIYVDVSAKKHTNLNQLLEMICLVADMKELKATPERLATGTVLEAKLDRGRGPVATVLIDNGTLRAGENFVVGNIFGKVRAMFDDRGRNLDEAGPSTPVEILGLEGLPQAGDQFVVVAEREKAREIADYREAKAREAILAKTTRVSLEGLARQIKNEGSKQLDIILKGDVQGSVEVINDLLTKLSNEQVRIKVLRYSVGAITESDVLLAAASNAIIIGFNVRPERKAQEMAEQEKVDIRLHSIIYELQDEIRKAMTGLLEPTIKETYMGRAEVRDTFRIPKVGTIAGCQVVDGIVKRDSEVRLLRDNVVVFTGKVSSLKRFKDDASEVRNGMECGIGIHNYNDVKTGDVIEAFVTEKVATQLV
ncbi:MAG: translation initiation factor IF-2 [Acidobacteria bacterium]|nr:MAG: translation initiation factor IF-2 [Acidobacteriota bacterium]